MAEDVKELKKTIGRLEGDLRFEKRLKEKGRINSGTKRVGLYGRLWQDVACQAAPVGVDKSVGAVAPVVYRKPRDVAVQAAVPLLVSTSSVQTDGPLVAEAPAKPSYTSVAT